MTRPYFEPDRESNRPAWETEDNWRSEEFWQDLLPVAEWRVELEKHRALEESSSRTPPPGDGSSSVQTLGTAGVGRPSELTDCRSTDSGAGGAQGSVPPALPSDGGWFCAPCDERHEFGDICWYWDVDPERRTDAFDG